MSSNVLYQLPCEKKWENFVWKVCGAYGTSHCSLWLAKTEAKRLDLLPAIKTYFDCWMCWWVMTTHKKLIEVQGLINEHFFLQKKKNWSHWWLHMRTPVISLLRHQIYHRASEQVLQTPKITLLNKFDRHAQHYLRIWPKKSQQICKKQHFPTDMRNQHLLLRLHKHLQLPPEFPFLLQITWNHHQTTR